MPPFSGWRAEIAHELRLIGRMLRSPASWIVLGVLAAFGLVMYFGMRIALRYDTLMYLLGMPVQLCRSLSNGQYLALIYMVFFFGLAIVHCLGNLIHYLSEREHPHYGRASRRLALHAALGGLAALLIGILSTLLLAYWC
jgi:hypothetical protein